MKKFIFIFSILILLSSKSAFAKSVFISASNADIKVGDTFSIFINTETEGEIINAVDMSINYNKDLLSFIGYKEKNGVVNLWIKSPYVKDNVINFTGIIPGGVKGVYNPSLDVLTEIPLTELIFKANKSGEAQFHFLKSEILKHDGLATKFVHSVLDKTIIIIDDGVKEENLVDTIKPEPFNIDFIEKGVFSDTPAVTVFQTTDKGSGVKKYEKKQISGGWVEVQSPLVIHKGLFSKEITIRAVDFYDNYQESRIVIPGLIPVKYMIFLLILLLLIIRLYKYLKDKKEKKEKEKKFFSDEF
ncbi:MAG: hypothetical protein KBD52_01790 [Candidatus Pacebacteria bacterium]|nr:hypothetical protein [Candidatus Paceibacterota bacterium]